MFLQYLALSLFLMGLALVALSEVLRNSDKLRLAKVIGPLAQMHDLSVAKVLVASGAVLALGIMIYGAIPGTTQEIIPRDALVRTQLASYTEAGLQVDRPVPELSSLEVAMIPHAAASWGIGSQEYRVWGLPSILAVWILGLVVLLSLSKSIHNDGDGSWIYWAGLAATLLISIWYPLATLAEPSIAVASSLRWLTAGVFFIACLVLSNWIRRLDRASEPEASSRVALFDQLFSAISFQTLLPWLGMGLILCVSVLIQSNGVPGLGNSVSVMVWVIVLLMAMAAMFKFLVRISNPSEDQNRGGSAWTIAASILLLSPLVAWLLLQIVVTLIAHPLTGPNPDTFFSRIGLAGSYAIPILMVAVGLISIAASRPNPKLAFTAAMFLMSSIAAGYLLVLKSKGATIESWVGLSAILSGTASIYSMLWNYVVSKDHRPESLLHWKQGSIIQIRQDLQGALHQISVGFTLIGVVAIAIDVVLLGNPAPGLAWASAGILVSIALHFVREVSTRAKTELSPWILVAGIALMGLVTPYFGTPLDTLWASSIVMLITGAAIVLQSTRTNAQASRPQSPRFALWWVLAMLVCISLRAFFTFSIFKVPSFSERLISVASLAGAWALSLFGNCCTRMIFRLLAILSCG